MSEQLDTTTPVAVAPRKPRTRKQVEVETPQYVDMLLPTDDVDDAEIIRLHDNKDVHATGQPFSVEGRVFILKPNVWARVPGWLLSNIDTVVFDAPVKDETDKMIGTRSMKRYPYEIFRG
jgi:hypothetical protein